MGNRAVVGAAARCGRVGVGVVVGLRGGDREIVGFASRVFLSVPRAPHTEPNVFLFARNLSSGDLLAFPRPPVLATATTLRAGC